MKTTGWAVALAVVATGCTHGLDPVDLENTGTGTVTDTDTTPTGEDDGSSDDGWVECQSDAECDPYCGVCEAGQCTEYPGCCGAVPEGPNTWRCSPPPECWDDSECPPGQVCLNEWDGCVPDPESELRQPPLCGDEVTLVVQMIPLDASLKQVTLHAAPTGEHILLGASEDELWAIDPADGALTPQLSLPPGELRDLQPAGPQGTAALLEVDAGETYQLSLLEGPADGLLLTEGPVTAGVARHLAWVDQTTEAVVTLTERLDRWAPVPTPALLGDFPAPLPAAATTPVHATLGGPAWLGVLGTAGLAMIDAASGELVAEPVGLVGEVPVDVVAVLDALTGDGQHLATVSSTFDEGEPITPVTTRVQVLRDLQEPVLDVPFGTEGAALAMVPADVDGDGVEDLVVAMDGGRLDIYRMHETDVLCRSFVSLRAEINDLELGDVDGDGILDVIALEDAGLTVIHGQGVR